MAYRLPSTYAQLSTQSYVPTAQLATGAPSNTRRCILPMADGAAGPTSGTQDLCTRIGFTLAQTPIRCRFRIRNSNNLLNTSISQSIVTTGIWWGTPNASAEPAWSGDFTATPTQVYAGTTQDLTTELVTPWFVPPATAVANAFQGVSFGFTSATDNKINIDFLAGWTWHGTTGTGAAAVAGVAGAPAVGTASPYFVPFDIRMEYEFVGSNQLGFFVGTSLTNGFLSGLYGSTAVAFGSMGPDNNWPNMAGARMGHAIANGGVTAGTTATFTNSANNCWNRFLDPTTGTLFGGTLPDYAVIDLGINDCNTPLTLASFQANIQTIIGILQGLGIYKIYLCTCPPGYFTAQGLHLPTFQSGALSAALTAGAITALGILLNPNTGANLNSGLVGPGGGNPGVLGSWYDGAASFNQCWLEVPASGIMEGPMTVTASSGTGGVTLTVTSFTLVNAHTKGCPVLSGPEGYRQTYNHWIRQVPPNIIATVDIGWICEGRTLPTPGIGKNYYYYSNVDNIHPVTPAMYQEMAQHFVSGISGT